MLSLGILCGNAGIFFSFLHKIIDVASKVYPQHVFCGEQEKIIPELLSNIRL